MTPLRVAVVCVADCTTKYLYQSLRFVASVVGLESQHTLEPYVGYFDGAPRHFLDLLQSLGAQTVPLERYSLSHGPSNKMAILRSPNLDLDAFDAVMMCDCDVIFCEQFDELLERDGFQAKIADQKTLPDSVLKNVFGLAGRPFPEEKFQTTLDRQPTILYCNAGVLIFSKSIFRSFIERWFFWNDLLLEHRKVMGDLEFFTDQASLCLTADEYAGSFYELPVRMNYPLHFSKETYPTGVLETPANIIHYHNAVDSESGMIDVTDLVAQQAAIARFNQAFAARPELVSGPAFWDYLSSTRAPEFELGDPFYQFRAGLVGQVVSNLRPKAVADLGCGRRPLLGGRDVDSYTGLDWSLEAVQAASRTDPLGTYRLADIAREDADAADLTLLVDVLPYIADAAGARSALRRAAKSARSSIVVSGLEQPIQSWDRPRTFFHAPIDKLFEPFVDFGFQKIATAGAQAFYLGRRRSAPTKKAD
ncbi:MAG TPA: hypothetical protein VGS12_00795 [Caulobacteraceae bacterium]|nr:hypothetical protein [Caulobacteraceae bacterium]